MSEFLSKKRSRLIAGGGAALAIAVLLHGLNGLEDETPTPDSIGPVLSATAAPAAAPTAEGEIPLRFMPPPFERRRIVLPVEGAPLPSETAAYCEDSNWAKVDFVVGRTEAGRFRVNEAAWNRALLGSKAGLASWMSQCLDDGSAIEIVAAESGRRLAVYDPRSGLTAL